MDEHLPASNIGYKLVIKMGWEAGQGLGSSQQGLMIFLMLNQFETFECDANFLSITFYLIGRKEPIRIDIKSDSLGVGKLEEENYYHTTSTARRKALDSEKIAEETEEERVQRQVSSLNFLFF